MLPVNFAEENKVFKGPKNTDVLDLSVHQDNDEIVSCWKMSWRERFAAIFTGNVWLLVYGNNQPIVSLLSTGNFFIRKSKLIACKHCYGNGYKPRSQSYKGNNVNIKITCAYCKGDGLNLLGRLVEKLKACKVKIDKPRAHKHMAQTTVVNEPVEGGSDDNSASD